MVFKMVVIAAPSQTDFGELSRQKRIRELENRFQLTKSEKKDERKEIEALARKSTFSTVYTKRVIDALTPELALQAQFISWSYDARVEFDLKMQEILQQAMNRREIMTPEQMTEWIKDPQIFTQAKNEALNYINYEIEGNTHGDYSVDVSLSTEDALVLVENESNTAYLVLHGAQAGKLNTITGDLINEYDQESWNQAYLSKENHTIERYPELDEIANLLDDKYPNVRTVAYSNGGPKGVYLNKEWKFPMVAFDPVIGTAQSNDMRNGLPAEAHLVRTTKLSVGMQGGRVTNPSRLFETDPVLISNPSRNVKVTTISPLVHSTHPEGIKKPSMFSIRENLMEGHDIHQFHDGTEFGLTRKYDVGINKTVNKWRTGVRAAGEMGLAYGVQKMYEKTGVDQATNDYLSGATVSLLTKTPDGMSKVISTEGSAVNKLRSGFKALAGATAEEAPMMAAAFRATDLAVEKTDNVLKELHVDDQNRVRADMVAGGAVFNIVQEGSGKVAGKVAQKLGYKFFAKAAEKTGLKILSTTMKTSGVAAVLGTLLDVGIESESLIRAWHEGRDVSSDEIGDHVANIVDPYRFVGEVGGAIAQKVDNKRGAHTWNMIWNPVSHLAPVLSVYTNMGDQAKSLAKLGAHLLGAKSNQEIDDEFSRIQKKSIDAVGNSTLDWKKYVSSTEIVKKALTEQEYTWMSHNVNDHGNAFLNQLERSHHEIWFKTARIMRNRNAAEVEMKNNVFVSDDLMRKIQSSKDTKFYDTLKIYNKSHDNLKTKSGLNDDQYKRFVNSGQDLKEFLQSNSVPRTSSVRTPTIPVNSNIEKPSIGDLIQRAKYNR